MARSFAALRMTALAALFFATSGTLGLTITLVDAGEAAPGQIEIRGVRAGDFNPEFWRAGTLHLVPDARSPLVAPREGKWRNIYAPSIVQTDDGWSIFYGGWDGVPSGNDRIYSAFTRDFLEIGDRHTVIEHGTFQHVCNVSAVGLRNGTFNLMCTAYPVPNGTNKPAFFHLGDAKPPYVASERNLISMTGYDKFESADINGMNVILREDDEYHLYFANFRDFGKVYRASARDGRHFEFEGVALDHATAPNDVKKFRVADQNWYLMGLHMNGPDLFYALSKDGRTFSASQKLLSHRDETDRFIVAIGFVTSEEQKLLGLLYGAGAKSSLDANRIFARWLQKRIVLTSEDGSKFEANEAMGPDRAILTTNDIVRGSVELFDDDGQTSLGISPKTELKPGRAYQLK